MGAVVSSKRARAQVRELQQKVDELAAELELRRSAEQPPSLPHLTPAKRQGAEPAEFLPLRLASSDPRWDDVGFDAWADATVEGHHAIAWVKVGYLRRLARTGGKLKRRRLLEALHPSALHLGAPPPGCLLFATINPWLGTHEPDPNSHQLVETVRILDYVEADNEDLVFCEFSATFMQHSPDGVHLVGEWCEEHPQPLPHVAAELYKHVLDGLDDRIHSYARIRTIVLPKILVGSPNPLPFLRRGWPMVSLFHAAYAQRLLFDKDEEVQSLMEAGLDPVRLSQPATLFSPTNLAFHVDETPPLLLDKLKTRFRQMAPVSTDTEGFHRFCRISRVTWLRVSYVRQLAAQPGPFPRQQDLRLDCCVVGAPPPLSRKFVCSHGWESEVHPSPSGAKLVKLTMALARLGACDDDVVFFDFLSLPQAAKIGTVGANGRVLGEPYFAHNYVEFIHDRSVNERNCFIYALWDMGRLYSYRECEVVVLPTLDLLSTFPGGETWGMVNARPYAMRGWCCCEFAIALYNERVANIDDDDVQEVLAARKWPRSVAQYADMMDPSQPESLRVAFTNKGDWKVVKYNFFKMTMGPQSLNFEHEAPSEI